jgi:hypothetical protein
VRSDAGARGRSITRDVRRSSAPFSVRLTGDGLDDGPRSAWFHSRRSRTRRRPTCREYAFARSERSAARRQSARAMGLLQIWAPGKGRSPDSGGETRANDFGELPNTLGRPGRALDARPRAESLVRSRRMSGRRAHRFEAGWRIRRRPVDPHKGATKPSTGRQTAKSLHRRSLGRALAPRDDCAG